MTVVGVTGSSKLVTPAQVAKLRLVLIYLHADELHHGDCVGADAAAHDVGRELSLRIVVHPPSNQKARAYCDGDLVLPERPYLDRNHDIVDAVECLVALPYRSYEVLRSGTWATIRYARKRHLAVTIIWPDGTLGA